MVQPVLTPRHGTAGVRRTRVSRSGVSDFRRPFLGIRRPRHGECPRAENRARRAAGDLRGFRRSGILVQPLRSIRRTACIGRMPSTPICAQRLRPSFATAPAGRKWARRAAAFGGYHAINFALRHPDLVTYAVSMSGAFDIPQRFLDGYYDQNAYLHCAAGLSAGAGGPLVPGPLAAQLLCAGGGQSRSAVRSECEAGAWLGAKNIPHVLDVWEGFGHDWPWWHKWRRSFSSEEAGAGMTKIGVLYGMEEIVSARAGGSHQLPWAWLA